MFLPFGLVGSDAPVGLAQVVVNGVARKAYINRHAGFHLQGFRERHHGAAPMRGRGIRCIGEHDAIVQDG